MLTIELKLKAYFKEFIARTHSIVLSRGCKEYVVEETI